MLWIEFKPNRGLGIEKLEKITETCKKISKSPHPISENKTARPCNIYVDGIDENRTTYFIYYAERMDSDGNSNYKYEQDTIDKLFN
ncbi:MAG: hypothetical protein Q7S74_04870 [Nanoarchaeota archaeon]|nr:hypothetical protein [Nanoarchaeota archaeon]